MEEGVEGGFGGDVRGDERGIGVRHGAKREAEARLGQFEAKRGQEWNETFDEWMGSRGGSRSRSRFYFGLVGFLLGSDMVWKRKEKPRSLSWIYPQTK